MNPEVTPRRNRTAPQKSPKTTRDHAVQGGTSEANRLAIVILEVLAGERTPGEAAEVLGLSLVRYFQLESRALDGLVEALEPLPRGKQPSLEGRVKELEGQLQRAQRDSARQQALVRMARRNINLPPSARSDKQSTAKDKLGRKRQRPRVRALKVVQALKARSAKSAVVEQGLAPSAPPENDRQDAVIAVQLESGAVATEVPTDKDTAVPN